MNNATLVAVPAGGGTAVVGSVREDLARYLASGGDSALRHSPEAALAAIRAAELRGRGGAGFPVAAKIEAVRAADGPRVLVANGEEGEPASVKDRYLMRIRPHLVLEGMLLAGHLAGADRAVLYVSDAPSARSVRRALAERAAAIFDHGPKRQAPTEVEAFDHRQAPAERVAGVEIFDAEPGFVSGEETALVRAIDGGPAKPTAKPPRPFEQGVAGRPTLVLNVESLARMALLTRFRRSGLLVTLSGSGAPPVLTEVPHGVRLAELAARFGYDACRGFLAGGFSGGLLPPSAGGTPLTHEAMRAIGSTLGCGALVAIGHDDCPVAAAADVLAFFDRANAGQCGSCVKGTSAMAGVAEALRAGTAVAEQVDRLEQWAGRLRGRGACGTLDAACLTADSLLRHFPDEIRHHLAESCARCVRLPVGADTRFRVHPPEPEEG
ncbi:NADH-ubiquinone oxidoreductase-F iron-sulfur binding region domain-containing protein [Streptomyces sp. P1-3]|uniref:NADH-ubiquinone oxidoreductase-F iron-sulfur binding region domain-containing protein n=1 Tax=Streptomyces sp. P1-3 TaxID=3421658 RepID=UPI003D360B9F